MTNNEELLKNLLAAAINQRALDLRRARSKGRQTKPGMEECVTAAWEELQNVRVILDRLAKVG